MIELNESTEGPLNVPPRPRSWRHTAIMVAVVLAVIGAAGYTVYQKGVAGRQAAVQAAYRHGLDDGKASVRPTFSGGPGVVRNAESFTGKLQCATGLVKLHLIYLPNDGYQTTLIGDARLVVDDSSSNGEPAGKVRVSLGTTSYIRLAGAYEEVTPVTPTKVHPYSFSDVDLMIPSSWFTSRDYHELVIPNRPVFQGVPYDLRSLVLCLSVTPGRWTR